MISHRRDVNSLSYRAAWSTMRWKSTARWQLWRDSWGEEPTRFACLSFCTPEANSAPLHTNVSLYNKQYICTVKYAYPQDRSEHMQFLRDSHSEALKEKERRHRFLAEKHCGLIQSIARLINKVYSLPKIAFANSIFHGLFWLIDYGCQMGQVGSCSSLQWMSEGQ